MQPTKIKNEIVTVYIVYIQLSVRKFWRQLELKIRKLSAVLLASAVAATAFLTLPFVASAATIDTSKFTAYFL